VIGMNKRRIIRIDPNILLKEARKTAEKLTGREIVILVNDEEEFTKLVEKWPED